MEEMINAVKPVWLDEFEVRHHECGTDGLVKLHILFEYMQEAAARHAAHLGAGIEYLQSNGKLWVLSRIKVEISRYPAIGERLHVKTYPSGVEKAFASRQFTITDSNGAVIIIASSMWLLLDAQKYRPLNPLKSLDVPLPKNDDQESHFPMLDKIARAEETEEAFSCDIRRSQIDANRHLNNAFYAAFTDDAAGSDKAKITELQLNFISAANLGDTLICRRKISSGGDSFYVEGSRSEAPDSLFFQAEGRLS